MELHLFGVTEDRIPWHTLAKLGANHEFTSEPWADANTAQGIGRPGKGKVLDSATVMDGRGNLHVLVVTDEDGPNKLWHAIRSENRYWRKFADVQGGGAGACLGCRRACPGRPPSPVAERPAVAHGRRQEWGSSTTTCRIIPRAVQPGRYLAVGAPSSPDAWSLPARAFSCSVAS